MRQGRPRHIHQRPIHQLAGGGRRLHDDRNRLGHRLEAVEFQLEQALGLGQRHGIERDPGKDRQGPLGTGQQSGHIHAALVADTRDLITDPSLVACWKNMAALAIYNLVWASILVTAMAVTLVIATLVTGPATAGSAVFPVTMLLIAMSMTSIYFTFRDTFDVPPEGES